MREEFFNTFGYDGDDIGEDEMNEMLWEDELNFEKEMKFEKNKRNSSKSLEKRKKHLFW